MIGEHYMGTTVSGRWVYLSFKTGYFFRKRSRVTIHERFDGFYIGTE